MTEKMLEYGSETHMVGLLVRVNGTGRVFVCDKERVEELAFKERIGRKTSRGQVFISLASKSDAKKAVILKIREHKNKVGDVGRRTRRQHSHRRIN